MPPVAILPWAAPTHHTQHVRGFQRLPLQFSRQQRRSASGGARACDSSPRGAVGRVSRHTQAGAAWRADLRCAPLAGGVVGVHRGTRSLEPLPRAGIDLLELPPRSAPPTPAQAGDPRGGAARRAGPGGGAPRARHRRPGPSAPGLWCRGRGGAPRACLARQRHEEERRPAGAAHPQTKFDRGKGGRANSKTHLKRYYENRNPPIRKQFEAACCRVAAATTRAQARDEMPTYGACVLSVEEVGRSPALPSVPASAMQGGEGAQSCSTARGWGGGGGLGTCSVAVPQPRCIPSVVLL